jgi:hypothetical protein
MYPPHLVEAYFSGTVSYEVQSTMDAALTSGIDLSGIVSPAITELHFSHQTGIPGKTYYTNVPDIIRYQNNRYLLHTTICSFTVFYRLLLGLGVAINNPKPVQYIAPTLTHSITPGRRLLSCFNAL